MNTRNRPKPPPPSPVFSGEAGFAKVIRGLSHVSKREVDEAIAKEKAAKKPKRR